MKSSERGRRRTGTERLLYPSRRDWIVFIRVSDRCDIFAVLFCTLCGFCCYLVNNEVESERWVCFEAVR